MLMGHNGLLHEINYYYNYMIMIPLYYTVKFNEIFFPCRITDELSGQVIITLSNYRRTIRPGRHNQGRVVRWCWLNFQCRGVLLIWIRVGQGPTALVVGAGGGCLDIFSLVYPFSSLSLSLSLWETARNRLKDCLKGPLSPETTNQPT